MPFALDYRRKTLSRKKPIYLSGNIEKDMTYFQSFYLDKYGINDKNKTPFILKDFTFIN